MSFLTQFGTEAGAGAATRSPEWDLLLQCAQQTDVSQTPGSIDWDLFLRLAQRHGLSAIVNRALRAVELPGTARQNLKTGGRLAIQQGLRLTAVLREVLESLQASRIRCLAYKGPVLSFQLFGDASVRTAVDLDVLVSPQDVHAAIRTLTDIGFQPSRSYPRSVMGQLVSYRAEFGMMREGLLLELQWQLVPRYFTVPFNFEKAWTRRSICSLLGYDFSTLCPEDNLLTLCVHGTKHQWEQLKWVLDVDLLIRRTPDLDWQRVLAQGGVLRIVLTSLEVAWSVLDTPLPVMIRQAVANDPEALRIARKLEADLRAGTAAGENGHHRLMLSLRERWLDRARYVWRLAYQPTEQEWDSASLPSGLQWLYYPLRVGRVLIKAFA